MAVECFRFREKGAELRSTLTGVRGDVRAEQHMVSILIRMILLSLSFNAPFLLLSVRASAQTSRMSIYFMILWQNHLLTLKGERVCACVYKCTTSSWALDMCVLLAHACVRSCVLEPAHCQWPKHSKSKSVFHSVECYNMKARRSPVNSFPPAPLKQYTGEQDEVKMSKAMA